MSGAGVGVGIGALTTVLAIFGLPTIAWAILGAIAASVLVYSLLHVEEI